jgi:hypothetical protein
MASLTGFCLLHRIIHSLNTALCYSATLTSLDSAMNSDYLNSSLTCSSAVQILTRVISTPLSFKSILISICQTHTPLSWSPTLTSTTLWQLWHYDYSDVMTTPTLWQLQLFLSSITHLLHPDFMILMKLRRRKVERVQHMNWGHIVSLTQSLSLEIRLPDNSDVLQTSNSNLLNNSDSLTIPTFEHLLTRLSDIGNL